ncbi:replication factor C large subunit [Candidatus Pacearchaeota archaeon]|nr:replication factor C large subunit [Candidatus Pacearchaeota archaeon]
MVLLTEKYRPKGIKEVLGQKEAIEKISDFIKNFKSLSKKALILYGPSGTGKTSTIYAIARDLNYEVIEINPSEAINKQHLQDSLGKSSKNFSFFKKGKLFLIEEAESIERGASPEIIKILSESRWPMFLIANDAYSDKLKEIRKVSSLVQFKPIKKEDIMHILKKISLSEKLKIQDKALETLASYARGDLRAAINDFQLLSCEKEILLDHILTLYLREKDETIFDALRIIFKSKDNPNIASAFDYVRNMDFDDFFLWIDENLPREYKDKELIKAYSALSSADVFKGRIRRNQYWRFLIYINYFLTAGISNAKKLPNNKYVQYSQPTKLLKIWMIKQKQAEKIEFLKKFSKQNHCSYKKAQQQWFYLNTILKPLEKTNKCEECLKEI